MCDTDQLYGPLPLTGGNPVSADALVAAYPWPAAGTWVRAMMVTTLDGAATGPDGLSGSVSSAADQLVFNTVRRYADAVLIGAGTLRAERYTPMIAKQADQDGRTAAGQRPAPVIAVVSGSLDLPWDLPVWRESACRPMVLTSPGAPGDRLATAREHADVITLDATTPDAIIHALTERRLTRIVCEGGPRLLRDLIAADLVDEADITISPAFAGTATSPPTPPLPKVAQFRLAHVLQGDGALMARYLAERDLDTLVPRYSATAASPPHHSATAASPPHHSATAASSPHHSATAASSPRDSATAASPPRDSATAASPPRDSATAHD